jgi:hypothetical protein
MTMAHGTRYTEEELESLAGRYASGSPEPARSEVIETERSDRTAVLSLRLPVAILSMLKEAAEEAGTGATVFARDLIITGLSERRSLPSISVPVVDLMSFAMMKAREAKPEGRTTQRAAAKKAAAKASPAKASAKASPANASRAKETPGKAAAKAAPTASPFRAAAKATPSKATPTKATPGKVAGKATPTKATPGKIVAKATPNKAVSQRNRAVGG